MRRVGIHVRLAFVGAAAALTLAAAPVGFGARNPTPAELKGMTAVVQGFYGYWWYYDSDTGAKVKLLSPKVSTVDRRWAMTSVSGPALKSRGGTLGDRVLLMRVTEPTGHGASGTRWIVADAPSSEFIGCGVAPAAVTADLFRGTGGC